MTPLLGIDALRARLAGRVIDESDREYDPARAVWNGDIDRRPAAIARCAGPSDVAEALTFGRERGLSISVRGGAHGFWEARLADGALVIDLSDLRGVSADPGSRRAWCSGGATVAELDTTTQRHGLAVTAGMISHTGMGGLTLGGGLGWLVRKAGLTVDNLVSAEVVTANGRILWASADEHPDLFWALRGGGGNFGVVTGFEFRLHEVGPTVYLGMFFWSLDHAARVFGLVRDLAAALPRDAGLFLAAGLAAPPAPFVPGRYHGTPGYALFIAGFGSAQEHYRLVAPIRDVVPPLFEFVTPLPYLELQKVFDGAAPWGIRAYHKSLYLDELEDDVVTLLAQHIGRKNSPLSFISIYSLGGAYAEVADPQTAFGGSRAARYVVKVAAVAEDAEVLNADRAWVRTVWRALVPHSRHPGGYVNFMTDGDERGVRAVYGAAKYHRLALIKARYDPENVFRVNANIKPAPQS